MNITRKAITTLGGIFLAALLISALAPQAARGVAAALVQIANTGADPVPIEDHARQAVLLVAESLSVQSSVLIAFSGTHGPFSIPAGKRLVIESVSGTLYLPAGSFPVGAALHGTLGTDYDQFLAPPTITLSGTGDILSLSTFSQPVRFYTDTTPSIVFSVSGSASSTYVTASGYLVNCAGACPAQQ
jgi:hypothetical protein